MAHVVTRVPLTEKEGEAIVWCLGQIANYPNREAQSETDPLFVLFSEGFERSEIMQTANAMFEIAYGDWLSDPLTPLQKAILRVCIENTTWVCEYHLTLPHLLPQALPTLRSLAVKLEAFGIEVNFIPAD